VAETETEPKLTLDEEGTRLQLEQAKAEFRRKTAEANAARVQATLPKGSTSSSAGTISFGEDAGSSLSAVVASSKLSEVAKAIADAVRERSDGRPVLVVDDRAVAQSDVILLDVQAVISTLEGLLDGVEASFPKPPAASGRATEADEETVDSTATDEEPAAETADAAAESAALSSPLGVVGDLVGLFRSDYEVRAQAVHVDRLSLVAEVAHELGPDGTVIMPGMAIVANAPILADARRLVVRRYQLAKGVGDVEKMAVDPTAAEIVRIRAHLADLDATYDKLVTDGETGKAANLLPRISEEKANLRAMLSNKAYQASAARVEAAKSALSAFDAGITSLTSSTAGATPPLVQAALRQQIRVLTNNDDPCLLWVDIGASGGDLVTKKSPLGWNSQVTFLGAVQAVFLLGSSGGLVLASGAPTSFGYRTYDFDSFFSDNAERRYRELINWLAETGEILVVGLLAVVVAVVLVLLLR
jgi:hypothetical protein